MLNNNTYNLMKQLVQEHKSLWRIKNNYIVDAEGNDDCVSFWKELEADKEKHIQDLTALLKKHLQ